MTLPAMLRIPPGPALGALLSAFTQTSNAFATSSIGLRMASAMPGSRLCFSAAVI